MESEWGDIGGGGCKGRLRLVGGGQALGWGDTGAEMGVKMGSGWGRDTGRGGRV